MIRNKLYQFLCVIFVLEGFQFSVLTNKNQRNIEKAKEILDKNPLIDGYF